MQTAENIRAFIPWIQATLKTYFQNRPPIGRRGLNIIRKGFEIWNSNERQRRILKLQNN